MALDGSWLENHTQQPTKKCACDEGGICKDIWLVASGKHKGEHDLIVGGQSSWARGGTIINYHVYKINYFHSWFT